jgi:hypothetical protein
MGKVIHGRNGFEKLMYANLIQNASIHKGGGGTRRRRSVGGGVSQSPRRRSVGGAEDDPLIRLVMEGVGRGGGQSPSPVDFFSPINSPPASRNDGWSHFQGGVDDLSFDPFDDAVEPSEMPYSSRHALSAEGPAASTLHASITGEVLQDISGFWSRIHRLHPPTFTPQTAHYQPQILHHGWTTKASTLRMLPRLGLLFYD